MARHRKIHTFADLLVAYEENPPVEESEDDLVIPEDLTALSDEDLNALHEQAVAAFDGVYGEGSDLSEEDLATLSGLTEGIEAISAEQATREQARAERAEQAAELAARAHPQSEQSDEEEVSDDTPEVTAETETETEGEPAPAEAEAEAQPEPIAAAASPRREIRVPRSTGYARHTPSPRPAHEAQGIRDVLLASGEGTGFAAGQGLTWDDAASIVERRLNQYNHGQYEAARKAGRHLRQQFSVLSLRKPVPEDMVINGPGDVEEVMKRAMDESRLPGGSLTAAGGWCAPSETVYDLTEIETRDGLFSLPEIQINRGGINRTLGPDFADLYTLYDGGFHYTEAEDEAGDYDGIGGGSKPCITIPCPSFEEFRLDTDGLCINAGLLQQKGYPESIARTIRGVMVAHDHAMAGRILTDMETGSTAVTMTADQVGTTAPLLDAIEMQVEHYRTVTRIARASTLEAVFPFWVRGAVRSDLARRNGVDNMLSVSDAQIAGWFRDRGVNAQFVYNWDDLSGTAAQMVQWPTTVKFLLYAAGTWVRGGGDVITLDTLYDSVLLGTNDYTALFTEEGYVVIPMLHDSRVVTVPVSSTGMTGMPVHIAADGTEDAPTAAA